MDYRLILLPLIGSLIGWLTNWIAIKLIFKPHHPVRIPWLGITIQGLIPKRKGELARSVARTVEKDLLPQEAIMARVHEMQLKEKIERTLLEIAEKRLAEKLGFLPSSFRQGITVFIQDLLTKELDKSLDHFILDMQHHLVSESKLGEIVEEQINQFEIEKLEKLIFQIVSKELKHIEILGGILGFIIGVVQALLLIVL